jgi:type II secretory pathway predicted ATPase ExeA
MSRRRCNPPPSPFCCAGQPALLYASSSHQEALARLHFLIDQQRSLGLLTGGEGSGKTLVLATLLDQLPPSQCPACLVNLTGFELRDFLDELASGLHAAARPGDALTTRWQRIGERLRANRLLGLSSVVLLDDADAAAQEVQAAVLRLVKSQPAGLTLVLAANPARQARLGDELLQLSQLRIPLEPWEPEEVKEYLQAAIARAGGDPRIFEDAAVERLCELSNGVPRWVAQLAELTWLAAANTAGQPIGAETVESAYELLSAPYHAALVG